MLTTILLIFALLFAVLAFLSQPNAFKLLAGGVICLAVAGLLGTGLLT